MIYAPGDTVFVESGTSLEGMIPQLQALGHSDVRTLPPGHVQGQRDRVGQWAVDRRADPRSEGVACFRE